MTTNYDPSSATTPTTRSDYSISSLSPDGPSNQKETYYDNPNFTKYFGNYKQIAKIKKAIDGYATWILGQGYTTDTRNQVILEHVTGWGEDTFNSILWNAIVTKKIGGDSYTEIMRDADTGTIINMKPLNPQFMRHVVNSKGRILRYDYWQGAGDWTQFKPEEILHLCNNRVVDEIHGVSDIEAVVWNVEATEEIKRSHRKMIKNNGIIRIIYLDTDDPTKIAAFKAPWKTAQENGEVMFLPKGTAEAADWHGNLDTAGVIAFLDWLDNDFYMSIGVPRVILGGAENSIEAGSKIGMLAFQQVYDREQTELEADIWNQLAIRIKFNKPASLMDVGSSGMAPSNPADMQKNQSQTGFQPNDVMAGVGK